MSSRFLFFLSLALFSPLDAAAEGEAAKAPAVAQPAPELPPAPLVSAPAPALEAKAPENKAESGSLKLDLGQAKLNLLLQAWYLTDSTAIGAKSNFRARRAEIKLSGSFASDSRWFVMIDPAKSLKTGPVASSNDNKVLQDLGLAYSPLSGLELMAGQFKTPTIAEGLDSSSELSLPERSLIARNYGDKRQLGFQASYKEAIWKITAMVSNGSAANADDPTTAKDINVRLDFNPYAGLSFGGWAGANDASFGNNGKWGINLRWKGERELARFEMAHGDDTTDGVKLKSDGFVAEVGYAVLKELQPVLRFERFFPNSQLSDSAKATSLGLNYFLSKHNQKLQAAYVWTNHMKDANGSYVADTGIGTGRLFVLAYQMAL